MIYFHCYLRNINDGIQKVNENIASIISWVLRNKLVFNADKTKAMLMGTRRFLNAIIPDSLPRIVVDEVPVNFSQTVKYLSLLPTTFLATHILMKSCEGSG